MKQISFASTSPAINNTSSFPLPTLWQNLHPEQQDHIQMLLTAVTVMPKEVIEKKIEAFAAKNKLNVLDVKNMHIQHHGTTTTLNRELLKSSGLQRIAKQIRFSEASNFITDLHILLHQLNQCFPDLRISLCDLINQKFCDLASHKQTCLLNLVLEHAISQPAENLKKLNFLLESGADVNLDFGYHGKSWPNRTLPPIVRAIQLSNENEGKDQIFFTRIVIDMIENRSANINTINDNPSPLLTAYNPNSMIKNHKIFSFLLSKENINPFEYDIIKTNYFQEISKGHKVHKAFQLLAYIDSDLRSADTRPTDADKIKQLFFNPLFDMMHNQLKEKSNALKAKSIPAPLTQQEVDALVTKGSFFSSVHRYYNFKNPDDFFQLIRTNDMVLTKILFFENPKQNEFELLENRCTSATHGLPTAMFSSSTHSVHSGVFFKEENMILVAQNTEDLGSMSLSVPFADPIRDQSIDTDTRKLNVSYCSDLRHKTHLNHTTSSDLKEKKLIAEFRRTHAESELPNQMRKEDPAVIWMRNTNGLLGDVPNEDTYLHPSDVRWGEYSRIKSGYRKYKPHYHRDGQNPAVRYGETIAHVRAPDGFIDFEDVHLLTQAYTPSRREEYIRGDYKKYNFMQSAMLDLQALQKQRQYYNLTGQMLPILRASAEESKPRLMEIDAIASLQLFLSSCQASDSSINGFISKHFDQSTLQSDLKILSEINTQDPDAITKFKNPRDLLLWSLEFGFHDFSKYLITSGIKLSAHSKQSKNLLDTVFKNTLVSGRIEESLFLMKNGASITDDELKGLETQFSDEKYNYKFLFNSILFPMNPEKFNLYYNPNLLG